MASASSYSFGSRLATVRKRRNLTQAELGGAAGTSSDMVGKYERGDVRPSIEVATRLADALSVSLDYLTGRTSEDEAEDPDTARRLRAIADLAEEERERVYLVLDALLRDFQARGIYER
ncbi:MAG: helix-turn-helix transcriptional regulator [Bacteroidota bacterium]